MFEFFAQLQGYIGQLQSFFAQHELLFLAVMLVFGLLIGSFLNVVILRLPPLLEHELKCGCRELLEIAESESEEKPLDLVVSHSRCPNCGHGIRAHENIPVISYVLLRGRCSGCGSV